MNLPINLIILERALVRFHNRHTQREAAFFYKKSNLCRTSKQCQMMSLILRYLIKVTSGLRCASLEISVLRIDPKVYVPFRHHFCCNFTAHFRLQLMWVAQYLGTWPDTDTLRGF